MKPLKHYLDQAVDAGIVRNDAERNGPGGERARGRLGFDHVAMEFDGSLSKRLDLRSIQTKSALRVPSPCRGTSSNRKARRNQRSGTDRAQTA